MEYSQRKRSRSRSPPPPWRRRTDGNRFRGPDDGGRNDASSGFARGRGNFQNQYQKRNQAQEDRQMRDWMSQEDDFVLKQSKKKARIRIKEGRAKLIDRFVLLLSVVDPARDLLEDDLDDLELEVQNAIHLIEEASSADLKELEKEVKHYLVLEHVETNRTFWEAITSIVKGRITKLMAQAPGRGIGAVSSDIDRLLEPKTMEQLRNLESQVHKKLQSDESIDEEYWEQLLESIVLYKAKAHLKDFQTTVSAIRLNNFREKQIMAARRETASVEQISLAKDSAAIKIDLEEMDKYDPIPKLKLAPEDQRLELMDESELAARIITARQKVLSAGYIAHSGQAAKADSAAASKLLQDAKVSTEDRSSTTNLMYDREAAKGVEEDEEVFAGEAEVADASKPLWSGKYRPRKPKHFNRVQMGYEWNKYNQTHYDHDNPPPKVVQGYKFNIFYPDLIDTNKAPTYRIERENGRRKGQSLAPAGEEDTCLIRFISGPPYEDIAFRIVDREWDYSAKRERGFKSSFEKGILQLHFQFKKIYYRK